MADGIRTETNMFSSALVGMGDIKKKETLQYIRNAN